MAGEWTAPIEVSHDTTVCITYRAKLSGDNLIVEATPTKGWHTFAMDNKVRADEKLAGKPSLGIEKPTGITLAEGLESAGPWLQTNPKDMSKPELRWYTWGFEEKALFATKVKQTGAGPAKVNLKAQACSENICKNVDITLSVPLTKAAPDVDITALTPVRR